MLVGLGAQDTLEGGARDQGISGVYLPHRREVDGAESDVVADMDRGEGVDEEDVRVHLIQVGGEGGRRIPGSARA